MKQGSSTITLLVVIAITLVIIRVGAVSAGDDAVSAKEAVQYLDKKTYTNAQIRDYYRGLKKKTVKGTGMVAEVKPARKNYEICVLVTDTKYDRACNLVINTGQKEALHLKKGEKIAFEGKFIRLTPFVNYYVIIKGTYKKI